MAVPYSRVTDQYGGWFKNPSPTLPTELPPTPKPATPATNGTNGTNTTKRVLNTTAQTEWKLALVVQPDPFIKKADNAAT